MTFRPTPKQIEAAMRWAAECQPMEGCGVIAAGRFIPVDNTATEHDTFVMDMRRFCEIDSKTRVEAVVHSHVYVAPRPSDGDRAMCEKTGLPWLIVSWPEEIFTVIEPCGWKAPVVGRQWAWGSHDCLGCIRDGFLEQTGIELPDFPREWLWWAKGGNDIEEQFAGAGFVRLAQDVLPRHCDVFGMQIAAPVVNHLGLFLEPDLMLHQMMGRPSVREVYGGYYRKATVLHLRHRELAGT